MFLTQVRLNTVHADVAAMLDNVYRLHQWLWSAFPSTTEESRERILFRVEYRRVTEAMLLVQSQAKPESKYWQRDFLAHDPEIRYISPMFQQGLLLCFKLRANPTTRTRNPLGSASGQIGKRKAIRGKTQQIQWLENKSRQHGFSILSCQVNEMNIQMSSKENSMEQIYQYGVTYRGIIRVDDSKVFMATFRDGIGAGKGFGFGLLSVAPFSGTPTACCRQTEMFLLRG